MENQKVGRKKNFTLLLIPLMCFSAIGIALFSQHVLGMQPCAWCILQRIIFIVLGGFGIIFYFASGLTKIGAHLLSLISLSGIATATYQILVASKSNNCAVSLAEKIAFESGLSELMPNVFGVFALCADASPKIIGIPYPYYSLILFLIVLCLSISILLNKR